MTRYANSTSVSSGKSRDEIERTLLKYGADSFMYGWEGAQAVIGFRMHGRMLRFLVSLPPKDADEFKYTPSKRRERSPVDQFKVWEQAVRQRWRALALIVKAKLEAVETEITTFEEEFMPHILLPSGETVGQYMIPQIEQAYSTGEMPKMLPMLEAPHN